MSMLALFCMEARGPREVINRLPGIYLWVMVSSLPYAAEVVSRMYGGRAGSKNRIKELKEDLSLVLLRTTIIR